MRRINAQRNGSQRYCSVVALLSGAVLVGCSSPPSVLPAMQLVQAALLEESRQVEADAALEAAHLDHVRDGLARAYEADLKDAASLTPDWVMEATTAYIAAREALLQQEQAWADRRATRLDNLRLAASTQRSAAALLAEQDRVVTQLVGTDFWGWFDGDGVRDQEGSR